MTTNTYHNRFTRGLSAIMAAMLAVSLLPINAVAKPPAPDSSITQAVLAEPAAAKGDVPAKAEAEAELQAAEPPAPPSLDLITVTSYPFSNSAGVALEDMSTGTTTLVAAASDDGNSTLNNIGFDFWYDGVRFTGFGANANGFIRMGLAPTGTSFTNSLASTTEAPKICAYWDDIWVGTNGKVHFKTVGSAPNRKLVVEWQNMTIPRQASATTGAGTFQAWLFETTGVIEFVYGNGIIVNAANAGYSIGLQSGAATNFASVSTAGPTVSYVTADNAQTAAITAGTAYLFTPVVPTAPSAVNFTGTTAIATTVNWTDNSSNEVGFAVYRSTDGGANYTFVTQTAANATSYADSGLSPSTLYFYQVRAISEGALSAPATNSVTTPAAGNISSTAGGGNWSAAATWVGGVVPAATDNVTIVTGATVIIDSSNAFSVTIQSGGILQFEDATLRTLTVTTNVTINCGRNIPDQRDGGSRGSRALPGGQSDQQRHPRLP